MGLAQLTSGQGQRSRGDHGISIGCDPREDRVMALRIEGQFDMSGVHIGFGSVGGRDQIRVLITDYLLSDAVLVELDIEYVGGVAELAFGRLLRAVRLECGQATD